MSEELDLHVPPHNDDAEKAVLGALLLQPERTPEVAELLQAEDFFSKRHQRMFECLVELSQRGAAIDFLTVREALRASGLYQAIGGEETLVELASSVTSAAHVGAHAKLVLGEAKRRHVIAAATDAIKCARDTRVADDEVPRMLADVERKMLEATAGFSTRAEVIPIARVLEEAFRRLADRDDVGFSTGIADLDNMLVNIQRGELMLIAARPGCGKTALGTQIALNLARERARTAGDDIPRGARILFLSLEVHEHLLAYRCVANLGDVDGRRFRGKTFNQAEWQAALHARQELAKLPIDFLKLPDATPSALLAAVRRHAAQGGLDVLVIDYLQLMEAPDKEKRHLEIAAISRIAKKIAVDFNIAVIGLSQLSRDGAKADEPELYHLRESGSLEQDADIVVMLWRRRPKPEDSGGVDAATQAETDESKPVDLYCKVAKHRHGAQGFACLSWKRNTFRIADKAREEPGAEACENAHANRWPRDAGLPFHEPATNGREH